MRMFLIGAVILIMPMFALAKNNSGNIQCNPKQISETIKGKDYSHIDGFTNLITVDLENLSFYSKHSKEPCASAVRKGLSETGAAAYDSHLEAISNPEQKKAFLETFDVFKKAISPNLSEAKYESLVSDYYDASNKFNELLNPSKWIENVVKDEMRGTVTHVFTLRSNDKHELSPPYKEATAEILVFQKEVKGGYSEASYMINVNDGQLSYPVNNAEVLARFDDGISKGRISNFDGATCGDKNQQFCFYGYAQIEMAVNIRSSKYAIMELNFFNDGPRQFHFDVAGLPLKRASR